MGIVLAGMPLVFSLGCGESRPDPRANPEFSEESYNDVDVLPGMTDGDNAVAP